MRKAIGPYNPCQSFHGTSSFYKKTALSQSDSQFYSSAQQVYSSAYLEPPPILPNNPYWKNPNGSSVEVIRSLLPHDPSGPCICYFYIATQEGFSLLLYDSKLENSFMRSFLSGCDPVGGRVDPVIIETRYQQIPPKLFELLARRMNRVEGLPPHVAVQGNWLSPDYRYSSRALGTELVRLLYGRTNNELFALFNLKLVPNTWKPIVHNQPLKGVSFGHADKDELTIWLHESNSQALGSALKEIRKVSRKLQQMINSHEGALKAAEQFKNGKLTLEKLLQSLFKAFPYCKPLIQTFRTAPSERALLDQIVSNAEEYLRSVRAEKKQVDVELGQLEAYESKAQEIENAKENPIEAQRLKRELEALPCPNSCAGSTGQIRKRKALSETEKKHYLRKNLNDTLQLLIRYHHFLLKFTPSETRDWLEKGKQLLIDKAKCIILDPRSKISISSFGFSKDLNHYFGSIAVPSWEQLEWLFQRFAEYETNFQMVGIAPFLDRDITWLKETVEILENLLARTGRLTYDLETQQKKLLEQREILLSSEQAFLVKRLEVGGEFKSVVVKAFGKDPLETRDGAHIPIGK